jgi:enolase
MNAEDQAAIDAALIALDGTPNKTRLGGNAMVAASMSIAHAAAQNAGVPLWRYFAGARPVHLPLPEIQIFGGGAHAGRRVDVQDFMVIAVGASSYTEALDWTAEVYHAAGELMSEAGLLAGVADEGGYWPLFHSNSEALDMLLRAIERAGFRPGEQIAISLDIAASQFGKGGRYRLALEQRELESAAWRELLLGWLHKYPIVAIEDPFAEDDAAGFAGFTTLAKNVAVVGDDFLATNAARIQAAAATGACNAALIKPNQIGTLTETRAAFDAAVEVNWTVIVSARSGETEDVTIAHLAVGWGAHMLKVGSFARSERMAKWNEGLRIAEALGGLGTLPPRSAFPWGR